MSRLREVVGVETRTILVVVLGLLFVEVAVRLAGERLSGDVVHIEKIGEIAGDLAQAEGFRILFVGNSLIGDGLDSERLESILAESLRIPVRVAKIRPDGTSPLEWYYLIDRHVFDPGARPDVLVIAFGPGHLFDRSGNQAVLRLAAHHVAWDQVGEVFAEDLEGFDAGAQFVLARVSRAYALRDRVQPRVLDQVIPGYQDLAPLILRDRPTGAEVDAGQEQRGTRLLERILGRAQREGVPVLFVAMPSGPGWVVDPGVERLIREHSLGLLDLNEELPLPPERFPDGQHLDDVGRRIFTDSLASSIAPLLSRMPE